jgi:hypothetical protein
VIVWEFSMVYSVFEPPERGRGATDHAERFMFVRDGFSIAAFLFGGLWFLWHRLWLALLGYVAVVAVLAGAMQVVGASYGIRALAALLLALLIGLEASSLRRWTLTQRGWKDRGVVVGEDLETAERRFFAARVSADGNPALPPPAPKLRMPSGNDVVGLFPEPGANR